MFTCHIAIGSVERIRYKLDWGKEQLYFNSKKVLKSLINKTRQIYFEYLILQFKWQLT